LLSEFIKADIIRTQRRNKENIFKKRSITGLIDGNRGNDRINNKPGRGCKPTFNLAQKKKIREWTKQEPKQLKQVKR